MVSWEAGMSARAPFCQAHCLGRGCRFASKSFPSFCCQHSVAIWVLAHTLSSESNIQKPEFLLGSARRVGYNGLTTVFARHEKEAAFLPIFAFGFGEGPDGWEARYLCGSGGGA